jgi:phosphoglycerol transferase MdoB-like AlkP superfamily enzyme
MTEDRDTNVQQAADSGDNGIWNHKTEAASSHLQTKSTVDNAQEHQRLAVKDMDVTEDTARLMLLIVLMVKPS